MLQGEYSATLLTFIKLPFVIKIFGLSSVEWSLKTGFTVTILSGWYNMAIQTIWLLDYLKRWENVPIKFMFQNQSLHEESESPH